MEGIVWPSGAWNKAFCRKLVEALHDIAVKDGLEEDDTTWAKGPGAWQATELIFKKFREKNKGGQAQTAVKAFTKAGGLRDMYMEAYPCNQAALETYLDAVKRQHPVDHDDATRNVLLAMVDGFLCGGTTHDLNRHRFKVVGKFAETDAYRHSRALKDDPLVIAMQKAPWSLAQYKCLGEHPEWNHERMGEAPFESTLIKRAVTFGPKIVDVVINITNDLCAEIEWMHDDGLLDVVAAGKVTPDMKKAIASAIVLLAAFNSCARYGDLTPGLAKQEGGKAVAKTLDEASWIAQRAF